MFTKKIVDVTRDDWLRAVTSVQAGDSITFYEPGDTLPVFQEPTMARAIPIHRFRERFTDSELAAIVSSANAAVKVLLLKLQTRTDVDLNDPQVITGMALLVSQGLLTAARRDAILA